MESIGLETQNPETQKLTFRLSSLRSLLCTTVKISQAQNASSLLILKSDF